MPYFDISKMILEIFRYIVVAVAHQDTLRKDVWADWFVLTGLHAKARIQGFPSRVLHCSETIFVIDFKHQKFWLIKIINTGVTI